MGVRSFFRGLWNRMFPKKNIESAIGRKVLITQELLDKIQLWLDFYNGEAPHNSKKVPSLNTAYSICREVAMNTVIELETTIEGNDFLNDQYQEVINKLQDILEQAGWGGSIVLRPYEHKDKILFNAAVAGTFMPIRYDIEGKLESVVFIERQQEGEKFFTLLSVCDWTNGIYTIENTAYVSNHENILGGEIPLTDVEAWANIFPFVQVPTTSLPWFVHLEINNGEAIFSRVTELIQLLDENDAEITGEIKRARSMVFGSSDIVERDAITGQLNKLDKDMFISVDKDADKVPITIYNPNIRIAELKERSEMLKRQIESTLNFYYGTISEPQAVERTATDVQHGRQRFYVLIERIQHATEIALKTLVEVMNEIARIYGFQTGYTDIMFHWGDSIRTTEEEQQQEFNRRMAIMKDMKEMGVVETAEVRAFLTEFSDFFSKLTPEQIEEARKTLETARLQEPQQQINNGGQNEAEYIGNRIYIDRNE